MKIRAVVCRPDRPGFVVETLSIDPPRADEILVRIAGVGLCHTDITMAQLGTAVHPLPAVFGHEGSGIVEAVGTDVTKVAPGDHVVISFGSCGHCDHCHNGLPSGCRSLATLNFSGGRPDGSTALRDADGPIASHFFGQSSFASHALTRERNVVKVADDLPLEWLGPLGCGVQTGAGAVINVFAARPGSSILIIGGGSVGLSAVMAARLRGCSPIILIEPHASRRALATEFGATHCLDPGATPDLAVKLREIVPMGVDHAFDTTGIPAMLDAAMTALGSRGVLGVVAGSAAPGGAGLPGDINRLVTMGQSVRGIVEGDSDPDVFIPELIGHFRAGRLPFDRMIRTYRLDAINQAIDDSLAGRVIKAVLIP
jgi:aryl-alcohol dehydrogenase